MYMIYIPDLSLPTAQLPTRACLRLASALRSATKKAYECVFKDFVALLVATGLPILQVNHFCLLTFMEYLCQNNFSQANIHNYLAGIRAQFIIHYLYTSPYQHQQLQFFRNSMRINRPPKPKTHTYIDIDILTSLVSLCDAFQDSLVYKTLLLVAYFFS